MRHENTTCTDVAHDLKPTPEPGHLAHKSITAISPLQTTHALTHTYLTQLSVTTCKMHIYFAALVPQNEDDADLRAKIRKLESQIKALTSEMLLQKSTFSATFLL